MSIPNEETSGRDEARRAYKESQTSLSATDRMISEAREALDRVSQLRRENHFAMKFGAVIRGARQDE